jgi:hypothetical protein
MQATVTTWRIADPYRGDDFPIMLRDLIGENLETFRRLGLLDLMFVRTSPDSLTVVNVYEDDVDPDAMLAEQNRTLGPALAGKLELIQRASGPAYDTSDLLE